MSDKKFMVRKKFWFQKKCGSNKFLGLKNFGSQKILDPKIFLVQKEISGPKNLGHKNSWCKQKLWVQKNFYPKKFWVQKCFGSLRGNLQKKPSTGWSIMTVKEHEFIAQAKKQHISWDRFPFLHFDI